MFFFFLVSNCSFVVLFFFSLSGVARQLRAGNGGDGGTNLKSGADGQDCVVKVPPGTQISLIVPHQSVPGAESADEQFRLKAKSKSFSLQLLADLDKPGQRYVIAEGGKGGRGNATFQSSTNRSPREATKGVQPEVKK